MLWSVEMGEGHAGPAIAHGCMYVMDYDRDKESDALRCLSLSDGKEVWRPERFRFKTPVFSLMFDPEFADWYGYDTPYLRTAVGDGYFLILKPLKPGQHVIKFTGEIPDIQFLVDARLQVASNLFDGAGQIGHFQEGFIDRNLFHQRGERAQLFHHLARCRPVGPEMVWHDPQIGAQA